MSQHDAPLLNENKTAEVYNDDSICFTHTRNKQCLNQSLYHFRMYQTTCVRKYMYIFISIFDGFSLFGPKPYLLTSVQITTQERL